MKTTKLILGIATVALLSGGMTSCKKKGCTDPEATNYDSKAKKDDGTCEYAPVNPGATTQTVSGKISTNTTWTSDKEYLLNGRVIVESGATLTIEARTIIKAEDGTGTNASALIIARGAKINAVGTPTSPIIFTSKLDNIEAGELAGTNLDENDKGLWGGLIVLGYATSSTADGDAEGQIEGLPATEAYGTYGGTNDADNSGTMKYISIRHGGALIGAGNEINGLTLGGVGSGTTIDNIEVLANVDDGVEFFGGTVNATNIVVAYQGDDALDVDQNYAGTVDNFIIVHNGASSFGTDEALEIDGPEGTASAGLFTIKNGTVKSTDGAGTPGDFKSKAQGNVTNVKFSGYTSSKLKIRASYQNNCADAKTDAFTHLTDVSPTLVFSTVEFGTVEVYTKSTDDAGTTDCTVFAVDQTAAEGKVSSATATGADASGFGWTWSSIKGKL